MARPKKSGLDYFPFDIDFFHDEKVVCVAGEFGLKGEICLIHLLCAVYRNGYFVEWTKQLRFKLLKELPGISDGLLRQIVDGLVRWGLFDKDLFDSARILTSQGIQERYFEAIRRRLGSDEPLPHLLIDVGKKRVNVDRNPINVNRNSINVDRNSINVDINPQSKVNKSKLKENISPLNPPSGEKRADARCGGDYLKKILNDLLAPMATDALERQLSALGLSRERFDEVALMVLAEWEDLGEKQRNLRHLFNHVRRKIASDATLRNIPLHEKQKAYREARDAEQRQRDANADAVRSTGKTSWQLYCEARGLDPATTSANDLVAQSDTSVQTPS